MGGRKRLDPFNRKLEKERSLNGKRTGEKRSFSSEGKESIGGGMIPAEKKRGLGGKRKGVFPYRESQTKF